MAALVGQAFAQNTVVFSMAAQRSAAGVSVESFARAVREYCNALNTRFAVIYDTGRRSGVPLDARAVKRAFCMAALLTMGKPPPAAATRRTVKERAEQFKQARKGEGEEEEEQEEEEEEEQEEETDEEAAATDEEAAATDETAGVMFNDATPMEEEQPRRSTSTTTDIDDMHLDEWNFDPGAVTSGDVARVMSLFVGLDDGLDANTATKKRITDEWDWSDTER